jgi:AraC family ethanolamine operon transcriptional activator
MHAQIFTDFEEFRASNPQVDGQWLINGKGDFEWRAESLQLGSSLILRGNTSTGLVTEGVEASDCYQFYVPLYGIWRNNGAAFKNNNEVLMIEPGAEYCLTTKHAEGYHGFFIPAHLIPEQIKNERKMAALSYTLRDQKQVASKVRDIFSRVITAVSENPDIEFSPAAKMIEAELRSIFLPLLQSHDEYLNYHEVTARKSISKVEIMHRAHKVLEAFNNEPIHVSQLAHLVGVSERTLRSVFNAMYLMGPCQYLRIRTLHKVHQDLLLSNPEEQSVTDILTRWGVWELGRFAGRYKLHFAELPNETLQRQSPVRTFF